MKILTRGMYYGQERAVMDYSGIHLSDYDYHNPRTDWHYHENPYFMFVLQGSLMDVSKNSKSGCPQGSIMFYNWQEPHYNTKETSKARGFHIEFDRKWFEEHRLTDALWEGSRLLQDPRLYHIMASIYYEFKCQDRYSTIAIEALVLQLCLELEAGEFGKSKDEPPWVERFREMVRDGVTDLDLQTLSAELGIHPVHLSRALPKYLDTTLGGFIRSERIRRSFELLGNRQYSLTEIAHICGFSDQSHFNRTFRQYFKATPGTFRKHFLS
jgi:AraC-like DNA-binding protein